jgi:hypothetical protein
MIEGEKRKMKYVLGITDEYRNLWIEHFDTKEALLAFFEEPFFESHWTLIDTVDWNRLEKYVDADPEYIASAKDGLGVLTDAYLRVIK